MSEDFGRYRLLEKLGGGSLGEVFRAESESGEPVALKRLATAHLGSADLIGLLLRESEIAAHMHHARLLGALDHGLVEGRPFLTQRLAREGSLLERLAPALARSALASVARDLCEALVAVHAQGYVHGDLSPSNLLFADGRALLADFGAATELGTAQAQPRGTYAFMSPEQVKGEAMDERSDVFSAATLLWLCASGERIFARPAQHLCFMAVVNDQVPPLPPEMHAVEAALRPALAKKPSERPEDVEALCQAFVAAVATLP